MEELVSVDSLLCALMVSGATPDFVVSVTSTCIGSASVVTGVVTSESAAAADELVVAATAEDGEGFGEDGDDAQSIGSTFSVAPLTAACLTSLMRLSPDSLTAAAAATAAAAVVGEASSVVVDSQADIEVEEDRAED